MVLCTEFHIFTNGLLLITGLVEEQRVQSGGEGRQSLIAAGKLPHDFKCAFIGLLHIGVPARGLFMINVQRSKIFSHRQEILILLYTPKTQSLPLLLYSRQQYSK